MPRHNNSNNHRTIGFQTERGSKPVAVVSNAITIHTDEYRRLIKQEVQLSMIADFLSKKDYYTDVSPLKNLLGLDIAEKDDGE